MIAWSKYLYLGENARKDKKKIISNIRNHKLQFGVYVIIPAVNGRDIFDVLPSFMLGQNDYKGRDICVLGLAVTKEECMDLIQSMILEAVSKCENGDIRGYFDAQIKETFTRREFDREA